MSEPLFAGPYRLEVPIASGGTSDVYRASHTLLPRAAAIKMMHASMVGVAAAHDGILREARVLSMMRHAHLPALYDVGIWNERPWIAMELIDGECLAELLAIRGALALHETARIVCAVVDALLLAHRCGIIHRDIKPANIMILSGDGTRDRGIKIIDWGIAYLAEQAGPAASSEFAVGTPHYMAPEQFSGEPAQSATDVYSLGIFAYELSTGTLPFTGQSPADLAAQHRRIVPPSLRARVPDAPIEIDAMIDMMLSKSPLARPSLEEVRACFGRFVDGPALVITNMDESDTVPLFARDTLRIARAITPAERSCSSATGVIDTETHEYSRQVAQGSNR